MPKTELPPADALSGTTLDLALLAAGDESETARLLSVAEYPGYFLLDFRAWAAGRGHGVGGEASPSPKGFVDQAATVYAAADAYFEQPAASKEQDRRGDVPASSDRGFKSCETDESFEMSTDEMHDRNLALPAALATHAATINNFHAACEAAAQLVLSRLGSSLAMPLATHHQPDKPSESGLKLISEPAVAKAADVLENKHRDSGSLTLLFYDAWSMHMCVSDGDAEGEWVFVAPPPAGVALVHGARALQRLTGGRVKAPLHRVTQPHDGAGKRYFLSYFLRPDEPDGAAVAGGPGGLVAAAA